MRCPISRFPPFPPNVPYDKEARGGSMGHLSLIPNRTSLHLAYRRRRTQTVRAHRVPGQPQGLAGPAPAAGAPRGPPGPCSSNTPSSATRTSKMYATTKFPRTGAATPTPTTTLRHNPTTCWRRGARKILTTPSLCGPSSIKQARVKWWKPGPVPRTYSTNLTRRRGGITIEPAFLPPYALRPPAR